METTVISNVRGTPGRKGVTAEQVFGAADAIRAKGLEPTNVEIQKMLGGSFSTISPLLRQWRGGKGVVPPNSQISEVMVKALSAHAQAACAESDKQWRVLMGAATADAESLENESSKLANERDGLIQEVSALRAERDSFAGRCNQQIGEIERCRSAEMDARAAQLQAEVGLAKLEQVRDELLFRETKAEIEISRLRSELAQTMDGLVATKVELALHRGRLEAMTDRMLDVPRTQIQASAIGEDVGSGAMRR